MNVAAYLTSSIGGAALIALLASANAVAQSEVDRHASESASDTVTVLGKYPNAATPESEAKEKLVAEQIEQLPVHDSTKETGAGLSSVWWALNDPAEAWRILAPVVAD